MKKIALASTLMIALSAGTGFAAPINTLENGQTAVGIHDERAYIEHKFADAVTVGLQEDDIYGQFEVNQNLRLLAGSRDFHDDSELYGGLGVIAPLSSNVNGYASLVAGSSFKEMQVGANFNVATNLDINLNYSSLMPDSGSDRHRTSVGAAFKF